MIKVHDHGHVKLLNLAGPTRRLTKMQGSHQRIDREFDADDRDPANAARMSFDQMDAGRTRAEDLKLCDYLMKNHHSTPFEMIECWIDMKLPIFVARQFVRHRTVSINEVSARYIVLPDHWYIPEIVYEKPKSGAKQGRALPVHREVENAFKQSLNARCFESYTDYINYLHAGVAPEQARCFLHVNHYTHWLWKQDLHNIMHFLRLRDHSHAQGESVDYARAVDQLLREQLPESMALYDKYRRQKTRKVRAHLYSHPTAGTEIEIGHDRLLPADRDAGWSSTPLWVEE